ncbi:MAG: A24 family peptidase [Pseudomonadales bacterium]
MENLLSHGWLVFALIAWTALCVGSFLNVVVHRLPVMLQTAFVREAKRELRIRIPQPYSTAVPRSHCPRCGHRITALENIPLVSWIMLRGRCSACAMPISPRYPLVELVALLAALAVLARFGLNPYGWAACIFSWILLTATLIDLDTMLLPDQLTLPLLWLGLLTNAITGQLPLDTAIYGAAAGYLLLWSTFWAFKLITGKEGMGYGDFKLLAALGAWLGWSMLPALLLIASVSGLAHAMGRMAAKRMQRQDPMPFGPYLAIAGWICLLAGDHIQKFFFPV